MSSTSKQIGWSNESSLLYEILKEIKRLQKITYSITGQQSGQSDIITKLWIQDKLIKFQGSGPIYTYIIGQVVNYHPNQGGTMLYFTMSNGSNFVINHSNLTEYNNGEVPGTLDTIIEQLDTIMNA